LLKGFPLRTKFLLATLAVSAGLTAASLMMVRIHVGRSIRASMREELGSSTRTYQTFTDQREADMTREARLLADQPLVRALMTTQDSATVQNEVSEIEKLAGSDLLVLADRSSRILGYQAKSEAAPISDLQNSLRSAVSREESQTWWMLNGHLYQVFLQPVYFGAESRESLTGVLALGRETDDTAAREFGHLVSSEIVLRGGADIVATTLPRQDAEALSRLKSLVPSQEPNEIQIGNEQYLASTLRLSAAGSVPVTITVLKSLDRASAVQKQLNAILLGLGIVSIALGGVLVYLLSHTITKPLANLVAGVRALSSGDFAYPLVAAGDDEVGEVTAAFANLRASLQRSQSEHKQLQERLHQAHKMEAIGRLAGGVAHDFNNLLTIIRGNSDILLDRADLDHKQRKNIDQIQKAAERAVGMTRQLLAFSRMQVLQPRILDLNTVLGEMNKMIPRLIGEHIEFAFQPAEPLAPVLADPTQIEQVILNLAVNARDAMPNGGQLILRTANVRMTESEAFKRTPMKAGEYVLLSVSDTGHGMSAETKSKIFEPFFTTKEPGKGTGLGLATVYGVVKQSGGFIWVDSEPGAGARFDIYLPATRGRATEQAKTMIDPRPGGSGTILLVEDEPSVRELAREFLTSAGYEVIDAENGEAALEVAARHRGAINLLLTDIVMPRLGGAELGKRLRITRPQLRVVYMSGYAQYSESSEEPQITEASLLQKPFSRSSILEKVAEVLASGKTVAYLEASEQR
jgi:signal transduction histidine kinase/ActR/RegA family two-component response regulator